MNVYQKSLYNIIPFLLCTECSPLSSSLLDLNTFQLINTILVPQVPEHQFLTVINGFKSIGFLTPSTLYIRPQRRYYKFSSV